MLNFITIRIEGIEETSDPTEVAILYIKSSFVTDIMTCIPFSVWCPKLTFIRLVRVIKWKQYLKSLDEIIIDITQNQLNSKQ